MYWTNTMKIALTSKKTASVALEILRTRLTAGFDCDEAYRKNPAVLMRENMEVIGNTITLPEDFGCYLPEDAEKVLPELMQDLATHLSTETFTFDSCASSDCDESWVQGSYENGELKVKTTYLPSGFGDFYCQECGEVIATMEDDEDGNIYIKGNTQICPECGGEVDLSDWLPVISEKSIKIIG